MTAERRSGFCDWPGCAQPATDALALGAGVSVQVDRVEVSGDSFAVCDEHGQRVAEMVLEAVEREERRQRSRRNLAPGDAEWEEYFGD